MKLQETTITRGNKEWRHAGCVIRIIVIVTLIDIFAEMKVLQCCSSRKLNPIFVKVHA